MDKDRSVHFEIIVDGKPRSYRDVREVALEAAKYLKERYPKSEVIVRDMRTNASTPIDWTNGTAFIHKEKAPSVGA
jgi:hypothetical protein